MRWDSGWLGFSAWVVGGEIHVDMRGFDMGGGTMARCPPDSGYAGC